MTDPMPDGWFVEAGIGEERAILLHQGKIIEAHIERPGGVKAGMIAHGRLTSKNGRGGGIVTLDNDAQVMIASLPPAITQGQTIGIEITREAIGERNRMKLPQAKVSDEQPSAAPGLIERCRRGSGNSGGDSSGGDSSGGDSSGDSSAAMLTCLPGGRDYFAEAGWAELQGEARSGIVNFAGGNLDIAITPAMVTIDVDGDMDALALSLCAAREAAFAIRRLGLRGSIAIDFPDVGGKSGRTQILEAFDAAMAVDCERSAVNGFGLLHIVTRRVRPSLMEILQRRRTLGHALALIRQAQWLLPPGDITLHAHPAIIGHFEKHPEWMADLSAQRGGAITLQANAKLAIHAGYAAR